MTDHHSPEPTALDAAKAREVPAFYIVDGELRVIFATAGASTQPANRLPPDVAAVVARIRDVAVAENASSGLAVLSPTQVVRIQQLDGKDGMRHYAVFLERFAARNSVRSAAKRFRLTERETEVLEGLMRGEATSEIATRLGIGATTVHEHVRKLGRKTNVTKRSAIVATVFGLR